MTLSTTSTMTRHIFSTTLGSHHISTTSGPSTSLDLLTLFTHSIQRSKNHSNTKFIHTQKHSKHSSHKPTQLLFHHTCSALLSITYHHTRHQYWPYIRIYSINSNIMVRPETCQCVFPCVTRSNPVLPSILEWQFMSLHNTFF